MKKNIISAALIMGLSVISMNQAMAQSNDGTCAVLGYHEPGTNVYDGPTFCSNTALSYITVRGPFQLEQTKITGKTDVSGPIKANGSTLQEVVLENNMSVETVTLSGSTTVNGNITFLGMEGVVYLENGSTIKGKVINGKVINQVNNAPHS